MGALMFALHDGDAQPSFAARVEVFDGPVGEPPARRQRGARLEVDANAIIGESHPDVRVEGGFVEMQAVGHRKPGRLNLRVASAEVDSREGEVVVGVVVEVNLQTEASVASDVGFEASSVIALRADAGESTFRVAVFVVYDATDDEGRGVGGEGGVVEAKGVHPVDAFAGAGRGGSRRQLAGGSKTSRAACHGGHGIDGQDRRASHVGGDGLAQEGHHRRSTDQHHAL